MHIALVAVDESGQRVVFGEMPHPFRFVLSRRDVAYSSAILETVDPAPSRETSLERKHLSALAAPGELYDLAVWPFQRRGQGGGNREWATPFGAAGEADAAERLANHVLLRIAEDRGRRRVPDSDHVVVIGAD